MGPGGLDETAAQIECLAHGHQRRRRNGWEREAEFLLPRGIDISFDRQSVFGRESAIGPKAAPRHVEAVCPVLPSETQHLALIEIFRIDAIVRRLARLSPILHRSKALLEISPS